MNDLPRLLSTLSPTPGVIKGDYEDFVVEEIPLYTASGEGTHTYFQIEKRGLSTLQAAADIAAALNVGRREIGFAGMKDARAVARQWLSVEHVEALRAQLDVLAGDCAEEGFRRDRKRLQCRVEGRRRKAGGGAVHGSHHALTSAAESVNSMCSSGITSSA